MEQHHVCANVFGPPAPRRSLSSGKCPTQQDRLGFHTFRRGDLIRYLPVHEGASSTELRSLVLCSLKKETEQGRKFLVLYDREANALFLGLWTEWRRIHSTPAPVDVEKNDTATTISAAEHASMMQVSVLAMLLDFCQCSMECSNAL
eukprot:6186955-Pleurochrysis_carterae.AAC.2